METSIIMNKKVCRWVIDVAKIFPITLLILLFASNSMIDIGIVCAIIVLLNVFFIADVSFCFNHRVYAKKISTFIFDIIFIIVNFIPLVFSCIFVVPSFMSNYAQFLVLIGTALSSLIAIVMYIILLAMRKSFTDKDQISFKTRN